MTTTLRKALERLSAAALARDSTMGDPCALLAAKAELADANKAACAALAAPQPEPVAYVPRCHTDGNYCIVGEYKWDEIEEKPFGLADPAHWECAALYAAPPAAPAPADWGTPHDVSGAPWGAPAPAVCDGGTCGLGGYCTNCPRLSAAPAVPPFNPQAECSPTLTQCPRCNNPHHACDRGAAPAVREPLTDEQIDALWSSPMSADWEHREFARAIEAHHGIGGGGK